MSDNAEKPPKDQEPYYEDRLILQALVAGDGPYALMRAFDQATQQFTTLICVGVETARGLEYHPVAQTVLRAQVPRYTLLTSATLH